jgi:hypothetical protein
VLDYSAIERVGYGGDDDMEPVPAVKRTGGRSNGSGNYTPEEKLCKLFCTLVALPSTRSGKVLALCAALAALMGENRALAVFEGSPEATGWELLSSMHNASEYGLAVHLHRNGTSLKRMVLNARNNPEGEHKSGS